jgi:DNA-binding NarL/FixJ family response regulator
MENIKILLVEDHLLVREGFYNLIKNETDKEIASELLISYRTIQSHWRNLMILSTPGKGTVIHLKIP